MRLISIFLLFVYALPSAAGEPKDFPIDSELDGPKSVYTPLLIDLIRSWPPRRLDSVSNDSNPVQLTCFNTPDENMHVGVEQVMFVNADILSVSGLLDNIDGYQAIFPGFKEI